MNCKFHRGLCRWIASFLGSLVSRHQSRFGTTMPCEVLASSELARYLVGVVNRLHIIVSFLI